MYPELHSQKDDQLERRDQKIFSRVVMSAGVAMVVIFVLALLVVWFAGGHIRPKHSSKHPTSQLVTGRQDRWAA